LKKVAIIHYAFTPVVGGVEFVIEQHAALFARNGYEVRVICGEGKSNDDGVVLHLIDELCAAHPDVVSSQSAINQGLPDSPAFVQLKEKLTRVLADALQDIDIVFVHNVLTMHFNLAATAAIWELADQLPNVRFVNWIHDLAPLNPAYDLPQIDTAPTNLIVQNHPAIDPIAISRRRKFEYCQIVGMYPEDCPVIPNGVEVMKLLELTEPVADLVRRVAILSRDIVLIQPSRILRRKNIECGIRVLDALRQQGHSAVYLVTGAADPHYPAAAEYGQELHAMVKDRGLERDFIFVGEHFLVSDQDLVSLYNVSDALFMPSKQEGFGLPLLEAGFFRLPAFCPGIEPMMSILENNVFLFELEDDPIDIAKLVADTLESSRGHKSRKETLLKYSWERLLRKYLEPLFLSDQSDNREAQDQATST